MKTQVEIFINFVNYYNEMMRWRRTIKIKKKLGALGNGVE
jgi:hypothetical protein